MNNRNVNEAILDNAKKAILELTKENAEKEAIIKARIIDSLSNDWD
jgi:hypothetical protein